MINNVVLVGRLTRDPELRRTNSGVSACSFTIAVDNLQRDADGNRTTSFINCSVFQNAADNMSKFLRKGSLVGVVGRLNQRKFVRKDGTNGSVVEVICETVQFLEPKGAEGKQAEPIAFESDVVNAKEESKNLDSLDLPDDDLPFL